MIGLGVCRTYRAAVTDLRASALCGTGVSPVFHDPSTGETPVLQMASQAQPRLSSVSASPLAVSGKGRVWNRDGLAGHQGSHGDVRPSEGIEVQEDLLRVLDLR